MSTTAFELFAKLSLDSSGYEKDLDKQEKKAGTFGTTLKNGLSTAAKVGAVAIGAATTAVVGFAKSSVDTGMQFDSSMSQVAATMGTTVDQIQVLRDFAQEMGATTAFSATEAADALNYMALAGYDADTSMKMLPNVLNLAAAGGIDLARASDMVTDAQSALGLSIDETSMMVDQMAKASSKSNTSVAQLGEAMLTIGATARGIKGGTVELSAVLGALADNGIKGAEGGTHLRNILLSLQTPSEAGSEALKKLGMSYKDMYDEAGNMRSIPEIMLQMQEGMEGMTQASKDAIISGVFNKTDLAAVNALIGTSSERFEELQGAIEDSTGAAQNMADVQLDNLQGDVTLFKSALEGAKIAISDRLTPALRNFVSFGSKSISKIADAFKEGDFKGAMDAFGEVLSEGLTMIIEKIPSFIEAGTQLIISLVTGLIQNAPKLIEAIVQAVGIIITTLWDNFPRIVEAGREAISQFTSGMTPEGLILKAGELLEGFISKVLDYLPKVLDKGIELVKKLSDGIGKKAPDIIKAITTVLTNLIKTILKKLPDFLAKGAELVVEISKGIAKNLPTILKSIGDMIVQLIKTLANNLPQFLAKGKEIVSNMLSGLVNARGTLISGLASLLSSLISAIRDKLGEFLNKGKEIVSKIASGITNAVSNVITAIGNLISRVIAAIVGKAGQFVTQGSNLVGKIASGISGAVGRVTSAISSVVSRIKSAFSIDWSSLGSNLISGIKNGISSKVGSLVSSATSAVSKAFNASKNWLQERSPSKRAEKEIGMNWALGIGQGFEKYMPVDDMVGSVKDAFHDIASLDAPAITQDITATQTGFATMGTAPVINVYATERQDEQEIAREVERVLVLWEKQRRAAFA